MARKDPIYIGEQRLRELCSSTGLSINALAKRLSITRQAIHRWTSSGYLQEKAWHRLLLLSAFKDGRIVGENVPIKIEGNQVKIADFDVLPADHKPLERPLHVDVCSRRPTKVHLAQLVAVGLDAIVYPTPNGSAWVEYLTNFDGSRLALRPQTELSGFSTEALLAEIERRGWAITLTSKAQKQRNTGELASK